MTRFDVLQAMTDAEKYADGVWSMVHRCQNEKEFKELLMSELSEDGRQCMLNAAQNGYPLSLKRLQGEIKKYGMSKKCIISRVDSSENSDNEALYMLHELEEQVRRIREERKIQRSLEGNQ